MQVNSALSISDLQETGVIALTIICDLAQEGSVEAEDALWQVAGTLIEALNTLEM
jgi:hypothetical protein